MSLLEIKGLKTCFDTDRGVVRAVDGVSFSIKPGRTLGVVGESGCGKSVTALSILRLLPKPVGRIAAGSIRLRDRDLLALSEREMRSVRGNDISMIFQEPMTSLNPVFTVGDQIAEPLMLHQQMNRRRAMDRAVEMLQVVGIPNAERRVAEYPHQLSGGQRQRAMIAMALACRPALLIADEPTTALDVTVQAQILDLMNDLKDRFGSSVMLITHALGVIAETAQRVVVMYAGRVVEEADVEPLFAEPLHPYTQGLLRSIPRLDCDRERLDVIPGVVPNPLEFPPGCRFHNRCDKAFDRCRREEPPLYLLGGRSVRCWLYEDDGRKEGSRDD
ncbi:ABC transporter ATP-binding protein [Aminithiophilus ramosus]|uniref:ABC transporter ATP-binding protein n=1 Tax=Aminithiophilus ramosus TaxID=3029084 RepID=A0A9Q7EVF6_9BACT|nr:ABC transporter ATP-binding protein [Aminithiophilus ramosus]QTX31959.1 ABC transporter ATP-binding protein [Aminithiophilus ramosus]